MLIFPFVVLWVVGMKEKVKLNKIDIIIIILLLWY